MSDIYLDRVTVMKTLDIDPRKLPKVTECKTKVRFANSVQEGCTILFDGGDISYGTVSLKDLNKYRSQRKGRILYKGKRYRYAVTKTAE